MIKSDGTPWRPLVHVEDIARAFLAVLRAPRERVQNEAFNVGRNGENYQIRDIGECVRQTVPGSRIEFAAGASPDTRCYRVDFSKIARILPEFQPVWSVAQGVEELYAAYRRFGLTLKDLEGPRFMRVNHILEHQHAGRLDERLFWVEGAAPVPLSREIRG
jgi:nucleoside-diphosphate-sugar epimerase